MIQLYDKDLRMIGPADNATRISYEDKLNEICTARLILPSQDPVTEKITVPGSFARLYDGKTDKGFYVFSSIVEDTHAPRGTITYELQSAEATLTRKMLPGWHELGGTDMSTRQVITYILGYQDPVRWVLGECDFEDYYQYNFEDVTLLEAIMSLGEVLVEDHQFVFDTTVTPWTLHLKRASAQASRSLVYKRNMTSIKRSVDGRVVTRLYGRGYGEGDNQLTIASVNGGLDYIEDAEATAARGERWEGVHVDTRQTDPATLKARMERILAAGKTPTVSYEAECLDLYEATGESWDDAQVGDRVLVLDEALGAPVTVRVTCRAKNDVDGENGSVNLTLDNSVADTAEELNEILDKIGVQELYSQGATNMYSMQISDNADAEHPLMMRFYVPGNVLRINSCLIYWQLEKFRTYATLAAAGGGTSRTSESGGGATVSVPQTVTSHDVFTGGPSSGRGGSSIDKTTLMRNADGGVDILLQTGASSGTTGAIGEQTTGVSRNGDGSMTSTGSTRQGGTIAQNTAVTGYTTPTADNLRHTHSNNHSHTFTGNYHTHEMGHWHLIDGHSHSIGSHTHSVPDHTHGFEHVHAVIVSVTVPALQFELEGHRHTVSLPDHTHELEYGVYEGKRADALKLRIDGVEVPAEEIGDARELDVARYLKKNDDGKVTRSTWHEIEFVPDQLTRITADLFFQVFIQSRGAGDY